MSSARLWLAGSVVALLIAGCNLQEVTPTAVPTPMPPATFAPALDTTAVPQSPPNPNCAQTPPGWIPYVVEAGDTLSLLASQTDSTVDELVVGNCFESAEVSLFLDTTIYLPRPPVIG